MWTRKELKLRAKDALKRNYWKIVLVTFLVVMLSSGSSYTISHSSGVASGSASIIEDDNGYNAENAMPDLQQETPSEDGGIGVVTKTVDTAIQEMGETDRMIFSVMITIIVLSVFIMVMLFIYLLIVFLSNPFYAGVCRFMLKSVDDKAEVKEVAYGFDHSYKNIVKTMFHSDIRIFAWALLFIVPGIYKKYQYRMVPYILAEHPDMDYKAVLRLSSDIMNGEKWHAFVLDLSFILWHMLGMITCGMVELFFVSPYVYLTNAALCRKLCELWEDQRRHAVGEVGEQNGI